MLAKKNRATMLRGALLLGIIFSLSALGQAVRKDSNTKSTQENVSGKEIFQRNCASCHFATTTAQKIGPGLKGMYRRPFSDGKKVTDAGLAKRIEAGGKNMPGFQETIKPEQVRVLISYLKTL